MVEQPVNLTTPVRLMRKMGHDLRTPLATLISTSELLATGAYGELNEKQLKAVSRLQRTSNRALSILDDFITYVKAEGKDLPLTKEIFEPRQLIAEALDVIRDAAKTKGIAIDSKIAEAVPMTFSGDKPMIKRIILALLWNAVAATSSGSITLSAEWNAEAGLTVMVKDTGTGIRADEVDHIFEVFWKGKEWTQLPTSGSGLGLSVGRALAQLMGGTLTLTSTTPQGSLPGSTFTLQLPLDLQ